MKLHPPDKGMLSGVCGVGNTPPSSPSILTKCVGKISLPNVVSKLGVFYHKNEMHNYINIRLLLAMTAFEEVI